MTVTTATDTLGAALAYAASGVAVFPCGADKQPLTGHGFHDAATDEDAVRAMWRDDVPCIGAVVPAGVVILDIDPRNGGSDTIRALTRSGKILPPTKTARTGGRGWHRWYSVPLGVDASELRSTLGAGVDVKRPGRGYVILPPSVSTAGPYVWIDEMPAEPAPVWLVEDLARPPVREVVQRDAPAIFPFMDGTTYGERAMQLELEQLAAARPGERNNALNRAAFSLGQLVAGGELRADAVEGRLLEAGLDLDLEEHEVLLTVRSGLDAGLSEPRSAPELADRSQSSLESPAAVLGDLVAPEGPPEGEEHFWLSWDGEVEPDAYILDPILPRNAYVMVYGPTEAAKSMVMVGLGAQASCRGFTVSVYSLENPSTVDRARLQRLRPCAPNFRLTNELINLADPHQALALMERERGRDLVILDTYSHAFAQRFDSGDGNAKAIEFARVIRWLMRSTGATFVVIDHTGFERLDEPRDASAKRQQCDVAIGMERTRPWERGRPAFFRMRNYKSARFANPFTIEGRIDGHGTDPLEVSLDGEQTWGER